MIKQGLCAGVVTLMLASCNQTGHWLSGAQPSAEELVQQVKECSRIYTSEYQVSKVIIHEDEKRIAGQLAGMDINIGIAGTERMIAIPIEGVLKGYVDMSQISKENIKTSGDKLEITLPEPKIALTSTSINHKSIKEDISLLRAGFDDKELTKIQQQGRDSLIASIPRLGILPQVKACAERTLVSLLSQLGYQKEHITINFTSDVENLSEDALKTMLVDEAETKK